MAVRILDPELAKTVRRVVERVVDPGTASLNLGIDSIASGTIVV